MRATGHSSESSHRNHSCLMPRFFDNIAYGRKWLKMEEIESAAKIANAHHFIEELTEGYETHVGDRGVSVVRWAAANASLLHVLSSQTQRC